MAAKKMTIPMNSNVGSISFDNTKLVAMMKAEKNNILIIATCWDIPKLNNLWCI